MPKNFPHFSGEKRSNRDKDTRGEERGATGQVLIFDEMRQLTADNRRSDTYLQN